MMALVLCIAVVSFTGCGPRKAENADTRRIYRTAISGEWETCDPQVTTNDYTIPINIFDRLVEVENKGNGLSGIVPGLATSWTVTPDGLVYNFKLRQNVKFHNGEIFKADDVLYTIERCMTLDYARNTDAFTPILGAMDVLEGNATKIAGVRVVNDYEIEITLEAPYAPFLANIATPAGSIFNRKATEAAGVEFGINPAKTIGTGPYYFSEWVLNDHSLILAFDDYWGGRPKNDGVDFRTVLDLEAYRMMFENGELDEIDFDNCRQHIRTFLNDPKWKDQIIYGYRVGVYYYHINQNIKPFDDLRIRKAFQMAIDRQGLLNSPLFNGLGVVHSGIMPSGLIGYNADLPEIKYNPDEAKRLMTEAGYPNGFDMVITQTTDSPNTLAQNELVQAMLARVGIRAEIRQMDSATWFAVRGQGELAAYTTSWSADFNDPDNFFYTFFTPQNTVRRSFNYKNQAAMQRVVNARYMTNEAERIREYQALEKLIIQDDAAWVPLFALQHLWVVQPWIKNVVPLWNGWSGMFYKDVVVENH
jgi:ABC-type transport system substrate-binding protein